MPKISVIVPVYKVEKYLDRCVESIVAQTFTDFELILVDDGSPDNCPSMCDEWAKKDSRIRVIHQQNCGLSAARNAGIDWAFANSDSEWLSFIDSDDWVHQKYLECLHGAAKEHDVLVGICSYEKTSGESPVVNAEQFTPILWNAEEFYITHNVNASIAWGKLYKKECFESIRFPVGKIHEDEFTTYKIVFAEKNVVYIDVPLYNYYINHEGIMLSSSKEIANQIHQITALEEQQLYFKANDYTKAHAAVSYVLYQKLMRISDKNNKIYLLKKRRKVYRNMPTHQKRIILSQRYPRIMSVYWNFLAIMKKDN